MNGRDLSLSLLLLIDEDPKATIIQIMRTINYE
jgi:hypothetical protein